MGSSGGDTGHEQTGQARRTDPAHARLEPEHRQHLLGEDVAKPSPGVASAPAVSGEECLDPRAPHNRKTPAFK
jgi:hypothetical protein